MRVTVSTVYPQSLKPNIEIYLGINLEKYLEKLAKKKKKPQNLNQNLKYIS